MRLNHALPALLALTLSIAAHADPKKACDLITQQEASAALGVPVQPGKPMGPTVCRFAAVTGNASVSAIAHAADPRGTAMSMDMLVRSSSDVQKAVPASGVGDKAVISSTAVLGSVGIEVLTHETVVSINLNQMATGQDTPARRDALVKTAKLMISRL
jgi:hypothetical protein